ncbi:hypothetical protein BG000_007454 [Podila horticola]|nr:hypothetical protein BG000_007454 [Podila horticola]
MKHDLNVKEAIAALQQVSDLNPEGSEALFFQAIVKVVAKTVAERGLCRTLAGTGLPRSPLPFSCDEVTHGDTHCRPRNPVNVPAEP